MELEFDVTINASILYDYMLHHTYTSATGLFGTGVGALLVVAFGLNGSIYLLLAGLIILAYIPWTLFLRSRKQTLSNPAFKNPLHYRMDEDGITVSQGEYEEHIQWGKVIKAQATNRSIFLYTSKVNAWIFPKADLKEDRAKVIEMISTHVSPDKIKIKQ